ncbi:MAG: amino acid adenylation domain-containing protein [Candidatus Aminicenantes bacterium]|nr:amino acid adenylation domain-containing protein [Candidatus Aminicenantes bacterium]
MVDTPLSKYLSSSAEKFPDKEAVTNGKSSLTYRELLGRSNYLARCLTDKGLNIGNYVVISMTRRINIIESIFGVLKAGGVYIPMAPDIPGLRRKLIFNNCRPSAIICDNPVLKKLLSENEEIIKECSIFCYENQDRIDNAIRNKISLIDAKSFIDQENNFVMRSRITPDMPAGVYYTSGTTGEPKGVILTHRNIHEYISWVIDYIGIKPNDRLLWTAHYYFDMSLFDIYAPLRAGATICMADEKQLLFPKLLVDFAEAQQVTVWKGVSSLLMYMARTGAIAPGRLRTLRKVIFSGEVLPTKYLRQWMQTFPDKIFINAYGPTEATGISMYYKVDSMPASSEEKIPLGKPCENTEIFLLDDKLSPVLDGEIGEIFIKGICVAPGYLNNPEQTRKFFIDNPLNPGKGETVYRTGDLARRRPDGNYEFLGRKDDQVKYMGYRIELQDIEQALISLPYVNDAAVILTEMNKLPELQAFIDVAKHGITTHQVSQDLNQLLPGYMIPHRIHFVDRIPRTASGKIDRQALQVLTQSKTKT